MSTTKRIRIDRPTEREERIVRVDPVVRRDEGDGPLGRIVGYAAKFDSPYNPIYGWDDLVEVLDPGCFDRTLREQPDVLALRNHDTNLVLGRTPTTLKLSTDATGLHFDVDPPDDELGRSTVLAIERKDIRGCSFGFFMREFEILIEQDRTTYTILDVDLIEVTPACTFPANPATEVAIRSRQSRLVRPDATPNLDLIKLARRRRGR